MAQSQQTVCRGSGTAEDLLSDRLYGGVVGSGKSVTVGEDIRELLGSDIDCKVIEITEFPREDPRDDLEENGWTSGFGQVLSKRTLMARVEDHDYVRLLATEADHSQRTEMIQVHLDAAASVAEEIDEPAVVALDANPVLRQDDFIDQTVRDTNVWITSQLTSSETMTKWVEAHPDGVVVLHSLPSRWHRGREAAEFLESTPADTEYVQTGPREPSRGNQILVGRPGDWERQRVQFVGLLVR